MVTWGGGQCRRHHSGGGGAARPPAGFSQTPEQVCGGPQASPRLTWKCRSRPRGAAPEGQGNATHRLLCTEPPTPLKTPEAAAPWAAGGSSFRRLSLGSPVAPSPCPEGGRWTCPAGCGLSPGGAKLGPPPKAPTSERLAGCCVFLFKLPAAMRVSSSPRCVRFADVLTPVLKQTLSNRQKIRLK